MMRAESDPQMDLAIKTLATAVVLGLVGNALLGGVEFGVGLALYVPVVILAAAYLYRYRPNALAPGVRWLIPPILLFASFFAWHDAAMLKVLNGIALVLLVGLAALRARSGGLGIGTILDYPFRLFGRWIGFVGDFVNLARLEGRWRDVGGPGWKSRLSGALRGVLIALPLLLLFGGLFMSADATFERLVDRAFSWDFGSIVTNLATIVACTWLIGGFLRRLFLAAEPPPFVGPPTAPARVGTTEVAIVLGALNLLFLVFVAIQSRYLFGGEAYLAAHGLTYKDFARRGFFEFAWVALLLLPVLIGSHALLDPRDAKERRVYNLLAGCLVTLLFAILISAAEKLAMYIDAFGITTLRIYVAASLVWFAAVFAWFCATTLRGRPQRFAFGALVSGLAVIAGVNVLNPEAAVVRTNVAREKIDGSYLAELGLDAAPELSRSLSRLPAAQRPIVMNALRARKREAQYADWRSWDLGVLEARRTLSR